MTDLISNLRKLGFRSPTDALEGFLARATTKAMAPEPLLNALCALESNERDSFNLQRRMRHATMGTYKELARFDWSHPRKAPHDLYDQLCTMEFLKEGDNVLLRGQSGVGKTTLAKNLGHLALAKGFLVRFTTLSDLLVDLLRQDSIPGFQRRLRCYTRPHLLIIDELGYLPADAKAADALYHVLAARHEKRSTLMTTNLPFKEWTTIFPNASCVNALVDRFAQRCHVLDIDADSWRARDATEFKKKDRKHKPG